MGVLFFAAIVLFYGIITIHDIPYEISVHRNHPHQDAIHVAGWGFRMESLLRIISLD